MKILFTWRRKKGHTLCETMDVPSVQILVYYGTMSAGNVIQCRARLLTAYVSELDANAVRREATRKYKTIAFF